MGGCWSRYPWGGGGTPKGCLYPLWHPQSQTVTLEGGESSALAALAEVGKGQSPFLAPISRVGWWEGGERAEPEAGTGVGRANDVSKLISVKL